MAWCGKLPPKKALKWDGVVGPSACGPRAGRGGVARWFCLLLVLAYGMNSLAQPDGDAAATKKPLQLGDVLKMISDTQREGNELTVLDMLRGMEKQLGPSDPQTRVLIAQASVHFDAVVGNYRDALRHFAVSNGGKLADLASADEFPLQGMRAKPALLVLDSMVGNTQIVMINEAHHVPQHRAFVIQLLPQLRKRGFRYFAAETLAMYDHDLQTRGYPTNASGYYTAEPVYGDLVRSALKLGYRVVPYEAAGSFRNAEEREQAQASNLVEAIFKKDAHAKVLIYAGYSHINEGGQLAGVAPLGKRLRDITGIDPLTIDQTVMSEQFSPEYEQPIYRYLMAHSPIHEPTIFVNGAGKPWTFQPGIRDITLFHPRSVYTNGRPSWLTIGGQRRPYTLPPSVCGTVPRCLVKARLADESEDAVPVDELEIGDDAQQSTLMLPKGAYRLQIQDPLGHSLGTLQIRQR
jgi:hypothetical protein